MAIAENIRYITIEGAPRERGRAMGEELRPLIALGLERWKASLHRSTGVSPDEWIDRFLNASDFMPAIERWAPHLLEEVRGIAEGADIPFQQAYAYQLMDEEWNFRAGGQHHVSGEKLQHCSTVAVAGGSQPTILAQNMDLPKCYDGTQTLFRMRDESGLETLVFTPAGMIGVCGLNAEGLGVCVNTLSQLRYNFTGLPVAFVMRRILEQRTLGEAATVVQSVGHASGQNYAVGSPEGVVDFEASANKVVPYLPGSQRITHTNHPFANDDIFAGEETGMDIVFETDDAGSRAERKPTNSERRLASVDGAFGADRERVDVAKVEALLSDCEAPVSAPRDGKSNSMTLGSLVMELSVPPVLHLAAGPPHETPYATWTFAE